jgi:uncharacterized lipoprotein YddW (UPF0748 family)
MSFAGENTAGTDFVNRTLNAVAAIGGGIEVWAWFEYGLIAEYLTCAKDYCVEANSHEWLLSGTSNSFVWLDARIPAVQTHIINMLRDLENNYPTLAGIQLDDHFALPNSLAGTNSSAMTAFAGNVLGALSRPVALSPSPLSFALANANVDWKAWANIGFGNGKNFHHYSPQIYRTTNTNFQTELTTTKNEIVNDCQLVIGIRCQGSTPVTAWAELELMIESTVQSSLGGASVWYSPCMLDTYASQWPTLAGW